jgi:hypothetical protein
VTRSFALHYVYILTFFECDTEGLSSYDAMGSMHAGVITYRQSSNYPCFTVYYDLPPGVATSTVYALALQLRTSHSLTDFLSYTFAFLFISPLSSVGSNRAQMDKKRTMTPVRNSLFLPAP